MSLAEAGKPWCKYCHTRIADGRFAGIMLDTIDLNKWPFFMTASSRIDRNERFLAKSSHEPWLMSTWSRLDTCCTLPPSVLLATEYSVLFCILSATDSAKFSMDFGNR